MERLVSMHEACEQLGVSERAVCRYVGAKLLEGYKIGRALKFKQAAIDDFIDRQSTLALISHKRPVKAIPDAKRRVTSTDGVLGVSKLDLSSTDDLNIANNTPAFLSPRHPTKVVNNKRQEETPMHDQPSNGQPSQPDLPHRFGERVRTLRHKHKLTQDQLADKLGISRPHLCEIETGKKNVTTLMLEKLADGFNISISELFTGL